jgi:hypothetical protein
MSQRRGLPPKRKQFGERPPPSLRTKFSHQDFNEMTQALSKEAKTFCQNVAATIGRDLKEGETKRLFMDSWTKMRRIVKRFHGDDYSSVECCHAEDIFKTIPDPSFKFWRTPSSEYPEMDKDGKIRDLKALETYDIWTTEIPEGEARRTEFERRYPNINQKFMEEAGDCLSAIATLHRGHMQLAEKLAELAKSSRYPEAFRDILRLARFPPIEIKWPESVQDSAIMRGPDGINRDIWLDEFCEKGLPKPQDVYELRLPPKELNLVAIFYYMVFNLGRAGEDRGGFGVNRCAERYNIPGSSLADVLAGRGTELETPKVKPATNPVNPAARTKTSTTTTATATTSTTTRAQTAATSTVTKPKTTEKPKVPPKPKDLPKKFARKPPTRPPPRGAPKAPPTTTTGTDAPAAAVASTSTVAASTSTTQATGTRATVTADIHAPAADPLQVDDPTDVAAVAMELPAPTWTRQPPAPAPSTSRATAEEIASAQPVRGPKPPVPPKPERLKESTRTEATRPSGGTGVKRFSRLRFHTEEAEAKQRAEEEEAEKQKGVGKKMPKETEEQRRARIAEGDRLAREAAGALSQGRRIRLTLSDEPTFTSQGDIVMDEPEEEREEEEDPEVKSLDKTLRGFGINPDDEDEPPRKNPRRAAKK